MPTKNSAIKDIFYKQPYCHLVLFVKSHILGHFNFGLSSCHKNIPSRSGSCLGDQRVYLLLDGSKALGFLKAQWRAASKARGLVVWFVFCCFFLNMFFFWGGWRRIVEILAEKSV